MSGLESASHGEDMARAFKHEAPEAIPLTDPRVQVYLAKLAYPDETKPMNIWALGDEAAGMPPLSGPYRSYIDSLKLSGAPSTVDINDEAALKGLLDAVKAQTPETLH